MKGRALLAAAPLLLLVPPLRHALESSMALHMLVEFPLLLAGGAAVAPWLATRVLDRIDAFGLLGATWLLAASALWMLPSALDLALLDARVGAAKVASWWLAGLLIASSAPRWSTTIAAFTLGNLAWMAATAGLLYQSIESRLCVSYLQDDQLWTGRGLVVLSIGLLAWLAWTSPRIDQALPASQREST